MTKAYHKDTSLPIGLFDSGVGGLSILQSLRQLLPNEDYIYLADNRHAPYGDQSEEFITKRVLAMADFLNQQKVKAIVVACNTATAAAIQQLRQRFQCPIIGVEPALKPAAEYTSNRCIGVLATDSTLHSEKYKKLKSKLATDIQIIEKGSKYLVQQVEKGLKLSQQKIDLIDKELAIFKKSKIDTLVLGCTHFPLLAEIIQPLIGHQVKLFESGLPVAKEVAKQISDCLNFNGQKGVVSYYSSDPIGSQQAFERIENSKIKIQSLEF